MRCDSINSSSVYFNCQIFDASWPSFSNKRFERLGKRRSIPGTNKVQVTSRFKYSDRIMISFSSIAISISGKFQYILVQNYVKAQRYRLLRDLAMEFVLKILKISPKSPCKSCKVRKTLQLIATKARGIQNRIPVFNSFKSQSNLIQLNQLFSNLSQHIFKSSKYFSTLPT